MAPQSKWPPNRIFEWRGKHHRDFHISPLPHFPHVVHMHTHMHMHTEMHTTATCYSYSCYLWRTQLNKGSWDLSHFLIAKFPHCAVASLSMDMDVHLDAAKDCKSAAGSASIRRIKWISWMRVGVAKAYVRGEIVLPMWLRTPRRSLCCMLFSFCCCWFSHMVFHNANPVAAVAWPWETGQGNSCRLHFAWRTAVRLINGVGNKCSRTQQYLKA